MLKCLDCDKRLDHGFSLQEKGKYIIISIKIIKMLHCLENDKLLDDGLPNLSLKKKGTYNYIYGIA